MQNTQGEPTTLWDTQRRGHVRCRTTSGMGTPGRGLGAPGDPRLAAVAHHMSMGVEYSVEPSRTSGGRYHSVTTSLE